MPLPQIRMPRSTSPRETFSATPAADVRVIHRLLVVGAQIHHLDLLLSEVGPQIFFELKAGVVAAEANFHVTVQIFLKARTAFVPPKPKELERATRTSAFRAWLGT